MPVCNTSCWSFSTGYEVFDMMRYDDVQDHNVREELLVHIAKEATAVRDAGWRALKVVSDIDDTFLCSGGSFPSGQPCYLHVVSEHSSCSLPSSSQLHHT